MLYDFSKLTSEEIIQIEEFINAYNAYRNSIKNDISATICSILKKDEE